MLSVLMITVSPAAYVWAEETSRSEDRSQPGEIGQPDKADRTEGSSRSAQTGEPGESSQSAQTGEPGESGQSAQTGGTGERGRSAQTGEPGKSSQSAQTGQPGESSQPSRKGQTEETSQSAQTGEPEESSHPSQTGEPEENSHPSQTGEPEESSHPSQTGEPEESSHPSQTGGPEETSYPSRSDEPEESSHPSQSDEPGETSQPAQADKPEETSQDSGADQSTDASEENRGGRINEVHPIEDKKKEQVFQVILPTNTAHIFDFIMDPQELISKTEAAAYDGSRFEEGATLFFKRSDGESDEEYSSFSDVVRIMNAGTAAVNVSLTAYISPSSIAGLAMTDDPDFLDDENPSLYLALTDGEETVPINSQYGASIDAWIEGAGDGEYHAYSFQLTGAVNRNGDWSQLTHVAPEVTVTWEVTMDEDSLENEITGVNEAIWENKSTPGNGSKEPYPGDSSGPEEKEGLSQNDFLKSPDTLLIPGTVQNRIKDGIKRMAKSFQKKFLPPSGYLVRVISEYAAAVSTQNQVLCALPGEEAQRQFHPPFHHGLRL